MKKSIHDYRPGKNQMIQTESLQMETELNVRETDGEAI